MKIIHEDFYTKTYKGTNTKIAKELLSSLKDKGYFVPETKLTIYIQEEKSNNSLFLPSSPKERIADFFLVYKRYAQALCVRCVVWDKNGLIEHRDVVFTNVLPF